MTDLDPRWRAAEHELRWFFQEAAGACGMKSSMGAFVDILQAGVLPGENTRELREAPETMAGLVASFERDRKKFDVFSRARTIHQRLVTIGQHHARTLELAFGGTHAVKEVSLALASECPTSIREHQRAIEMVRTQQANQKGQHKLTTKGKRKQSQVETTTIRTWLLWLMAASEAEHGTAQRQLLAAILGEATSLLHTALRLYCAHTEQHHVQGPVFPMRR